MYWLVLCSLSPSHCLLFCSRPSDQHSAFCCIDWFHRTFFLTTVTSSPPLKRIMRNKRYFVDHRFAEVFVDNLYECRKKYRFLLLSFVLMPDHFHGLIIPGKDYTISGVMQKIKSLYVKRLREEVSWVGTFWQKSFYDFVVFRQEKLLEKIRYILQNPVRSGMVERAEDYGFSTANKRFANDMDKLVY